MKKPYWKRVIVSVDQLLNTITGGNEDETISSRCGKKVRDYGRKYKLAYYLCRALHFLDPGHCEKSIENDEGGKK